MGKTITFLIHGGLGNQLFQYTAGLHAERVWGVPVRFHVLAPLKDRRAHPRPFMLDQFMISKPMLRVGWLMRRSLYGSKLIPVKLAVHRMAGIRVLDETVLHDMDPLMQNLPPEGKKLLFRGYWQSVTYMDGQEERLREELRFRNLPEGNNAEMLARIKGEPCPVSLHIRRGDYRQVSNGSILLPLEYYHQAIDRMLALDPASRFFVFSDDLDWARENLPRDLPATFVVGNNEEQAHEDLRLMSDCKHHIIANSSFSWWGAWLNPDPNKRVIMPKFWMGAMQTPEGLIPARWETVWTE
jgi:hypothetical protein